MKITPRNINTDLFQSGLLNSLSFLNKKTSLETVYPRVPGPHVFSMANLPNLDIFGLWEESEAPRGNPCRHGENVQTPYRQSPVARIKSRSLALWGRSANHCSAIRITSNNLFPTTQHWICNQSSPLLSFQLQFWINHISGWIPMLLLRVEMSPLTVAAPATILPLHFTYTGKEKWN